MAWEPGTYADWEHVRDLGEGGQGEVFLVRSRQSQADLRKALADLQQAVGQIHGNWQQAERFGKAVAAYLALTDEGQTLPQLGALKVFKQPDDAGEAGKARARFEAEVKALSEVEHPALLRLKASGDQRSMWMVTEYHPGGTLAGHPGRFKGDIARALTALRPVVDGVAALHKKGMVHRDIKPPNLFFSSSGELVLGDFGIVFFEEGSTRATTRLERVGSRDWMPGWAMRLGPDAVSPKFDVFALGKVLYCMIAGVPSLPLWYHDEDGDRLADLFPQQRCELVQTILDNSVRERIDQCKFETAGEFLEGINEALSLLHSRAETLIRGERMVCRVCRRGTYDRIFPEARDRLIVCVQPGTQAETARAFNLYDPKGKTTLTATPLLCQTCGHIAFFQLNDPLPAWRDGPSDGVLQGLMEYPALPLEHPEPLVTRVSEPGVTGVTTDAWLNHEARFKNLRGHIAGIWMRAEGSSQVTWQVTPMAGSTEDDLVAFRTEAMLARSRLVWDDLLVAQSADPVGDWLNAVRSLTESKADVTIAGTQDGHWAEGRGISNLERRSALACARLASGAKPTP